MVKPLTEEIIENYQSDLKNNNLTIDQIFIIRLKFQKTCEFNWELHVLL